MIQNIYAAILALSPYVGDACSYKELVRETGRLLKIYDDQGRLDCDPFDSARRRDLVLPSEQIRRELDHATCLVTGGLGCVGSALVKELLAFNVRQIIILDRALPDHPVMNTDRLTFVQGDIRDERVVNALFGNYRPEVVFHTAAQRDPGYAESHVEETITTNIFGALNIVQACERTDSVKQCVFSSTGKASRYLTAEVYAATKKICECIFEVSSRESKVKYSLTRFTHIIDNSLMNIELERMSKSAPYVSIHSPGKYVTGQNAREAARLMLNALLSSQAAVCNFLIVRNLEWPVESVEMALYHIRKSGRQVPLIFTGNPKGYQERFFRGQLNWRHPDALNLLLNVYECNHHYQVNEAGDIIVSRLLPVSGRLLRQLLLQLRQTRGEACLRTALVQGLQDLVSESLQHVPKSQTVDILNWGFEKSVLEAEGTTIADYGPIGPMMAETLVRTSYYKQIAHLFTAEAYAPSDNVATNIHL